MEINNITPLQSYDQIDLINKMNNSTTKETSNDEFVKMIVEQMFLNKVINPTSFVSEENDEDYIFGVNNNNQYMNDYMKNEVVKQLNESDAFGLLGVLNQKDM